MKETIIDTHEMSYHDLFQNIGKGNMRHVRIAPDGANEPPYSKVMVQVTCVRENQMAGCHPLDKKYVTSTREKAGYITIMQRK